LWHKFVKCIYCLSYKSIQKKISNNIPIIIFLFEISYFLTMKYGLLLGFALLCACSDSKTFVNFDHQLWQQDKMACQGIRPKLAADFENIRRELLGYTQEDIIDLLGKPDLQLLSERTQKFYVYFMEKGSQCEGNSENSKARTVSVRFNAMGLASEIVYAQGKPL
jgi:hypothetical protein